MECQVNDLTIYYEMRGEGEGIPLVMINGWRLDHRSWMADMELLFQQRAGWKRIYFDLPGMGNSPGVEWIDSHDAVLEVILAFLDHILPNQRFVLGGESWGAYLARGVVYRWSKRIDGLLLVVPVIKNRSSERELPPHVTLIEDPDLVAEMNTDEAAIFRGVAVVQNQAFLDWIRQIFVPAIALNDLELIARLQQHNVFSFDPDALPAPLLAPALILTGRQDAICGYRDVWKIIENYPRASFALLDRAGHGLGIEQKGLVRALTGEWLDRVEEYVRGGVGSVDGSIKS